MTTNIAIDPDKLEQIMALKPFKSKKEVVDIALKAYLRLLRQQQALSLKGTISWEGDLEQMRTE